MASRTVRVVGAGAMGAGIAQMAVIAGDRFLLADAAARAAERAIGRIRKQVKAQVAKGRQSADRSRPGRTVVPHVPLAAAASGYYQM